MRTLTDIIYEYKDTEFSWGKTDCCTFVADVAFRFKNKVPPSIKAIYDYNDYKGSLVWMKKLNCKSLEEVPSAFIGSEKKPISEVKLGDIVYYINEEEKGIMGVCNGKRAYFLQYGGGITARNIEDCLYCWSID